jgi:hypothetical protein
MTPKERRALKMKSNQYVLVAEILFRRNYDGMLLRCVDEKKAQELIKEFHEGICGGHFAPTATTHKIIRAGYYWPSIFKDSYAMVRRCLSCQKILRKDEEVCNAFATYIGRRTIHTMGVGCHWANKSEIK